MTKVSHDSEVLKDGQQVITACALIHRKRDRVNEVFLPKRASTKKFLPSVFEIPGGHIDFGEEIVDGLKREVMEEFGMNIQVAQPFAAFTYSNNIKRSHSVEIIYFAAFLDDESRITLDPEDHSKFIWVSQANIAKAYTENKGADDIEFVYLRQGLKLLNGNCQNFGKKIAKI